MICTTCKLKNDQADANQPDGTYLCYDCRPSKAKPKEGYIKYTGPESEWVSIPMHTPGRQLQYNKVEKLLDNADPRWIAKKVHEALKDLQKFKDAALDTFETDTRRWAREMDEAAEKIQWEYK